MDTPRLNKSNLSKHLLQMKFMQRSAMRVQKEELESDQRKFIDDEHWKLDVPELSQKQSKFIIEPNFSHYMDLRFGRISYKGFNPEIEKLMRAREQEMELDRAAQREREISVADEEMAERYSNLVGTIGKKFASKRHRNNEDLSDDEEEDEDEDAEEETIKKAKKHDGNKSGTSGNRQQRGDRSGHKRGRGKGGRYFAGNKKKNSS